jgi:type I restriction enzyme R subunit
MDPDRLYKSPFTDVNSLGVEGVFEPAEVSELFTVLDQIRASSA